MGILGAFGGLFGWAARDSFLPAHVVTVTPVIVTRADVQQEGTPLFQAAGWIEPQPSPVIASALAAGVIQEMLVVEGQLVEIRQDRGEQLELALADGEEHRCTIGEVEVDRRR